MRPKLCARRACNHSVSREHLLTLAPDFAVETGEARFRELYEQELRETHREKLEPLEVRSPEKHTSAPPLLPVQDKTSEFRLWKRRYVEAQRQPGLYSVLVPVFLGNLENEGAIALALFLEPFGNDVLRATLGQNLRLRNNSRRLSRERVPHR